MAKKISAARARAVFVYDPATGLISRNGKVLNHRDNGDGYARATIDRQRVYLHRLAWLLHYGAWPKGQVDHIDGNRSNNVLSNLRDVDHTANAQNVHKAKGRTGLLGVSWDASRQKYIASISVGPRGRSKNIHLGRYADPNEAHSAYLVAKARYHPAAHIAA